MTWQYHSFRMWETLAHVIFGTYSDWQSIPLVITEANHQTLQGKTDRGWDADDAGVMWIKNMYNAIARWNGDPGPQFVHGVCLYRFQGAGDPLTLSDKPKLLEALKNVGAQTSVV